MSRGLGKVQRDILHIIEQQNLEDDVWMPVCNILIKMEAVTVYPQSKAQSIWRAIRRLEKLDYVKTARILSIVNYSSLPQEERRDIDLRYKCVRLGDKRLVYLNKNK